MLANCPPSMHLSISSVCLDARFVELYVANAQQSMAMQSWVGVGDVAIHRRREFPRS